LLLIDALERHDVTELPALETDTLVNIYTLLSDVQRDANEFRQDVADVLLDRLHHNQPVSGQYGSVQRTTRRNRSLNDLDYDDRYLTYIEQSDDAQQAIDEVRDRLDRGEEVLVCYENTDNKRCHRTLLREAVQEMSPEH